mgnify:CR=1 FL=1|jgi:hypothetical protein|tara:strand:+ start:1883 stop:2173 length:291 start_codon:yes stop_codon:yes gene_type:complete
MKKELQIVRLTTGEELVCEVTEFPEHQVQLSDVAIIIPTEGGIGMMYFMPYADLGEGIVIDASHVMWATTPNEELAARWKTMFKKILTPTTTKIII